jgi:hypothetical protein
MMRLLPFLLLGLSACGSQDVYVLDDSSPNQGDDSGSDDTGGHQNHDSDGIFDANCPAYSGFAYLDTMWKYAFINIDLQGTTTVWVDSATPEGVTTLAISDAGVEAYTNHSEITTDYRCDADGLWLQSTHTEYEVSYGGEPTKGWNEVVFSPGVLLIPADLAVKSQWTSHYLGTMTSMMGKSSPVDYTVENEARNEVSIEVPAGTYDCLRILLFGKVEGMEWLEHDVGTVETENSELQAYSS